MLSEKGRTKYGTKINVPHKALGREEVKKFF
jgi:hypothetical protein